MWLADAQNTLNPTVSNSTGNYYVTQQDSDFNNGEINCDSDRPCFVRCDDGSSCQNTIIRCNDADNCDIRCWGSSGQNVCTEMTIYISSIETSISCPTHSCNSLTIFTDYTSSPSSNTELICQTNSCNSLEIRDAISQHISGYTKPNQFKIRLYSDASASLAFHRSYPTLEPDVADYTGAYYSDVASFIDISCTNTNLCSIDCPVGGCIRSTINCDNSNECRIKCNDRSNWDVCDLSTINARNVKQFVLDCSESATAAARACYQNTFYLENIGDVDIMCSRESLFGVQRCGSNTHYINNVGTLYVECNQQFACQHSVYNIDNVGNAAFECVRGCVEMDININSAARVDILCDFVVLPPFKLNDL